MEYTLEDALKKLKYIKTEQQEMIETLTNDISKGPITALNETCTAEDIKMKRDKLTHSLINQIQEDYSKDYTYPNQLELHVEVIQEMEEEILVTTELLEKMKMKLASIEDNIKYLQNKKTGLDEMKEACSEASQYVTSATYEEEHIASKRLFQSVKKDLFTVVDTIFPKNKGFKKLLTELTFAYTKGGDDMYITVTPETLNYVKFLLEADIVTYHRNDKTKVRMMDLL